MQKIQYSYPLTNQRFLRNFLRMIYRLGISMDKFMNWYKKFLKVAFRNRLDMIAISLCKDIFQDVRILYFSNQISHNVLKYRNQDLEDLEDFAREIRERRNEATKPVNISIEVLRSRNTRLKFNTFDIDGHALDNSDNYSIDVEIYMGFNFVIEDFPKIYNFLFNVARHEIQHIIDAANGQDITARTNIDLPYFLQGIELAADHMVTSTEILPCVRGIMLSAKRQHLSFSDMLRHVIKANFYFNNTIYENQLKSGGFLDRLTQIENNTYNAIMTVARTIFPNL